MFKAQNRAGSFIVCFQQQLNKVDPLFVVCVRLAKSDEQHLKKNPPACTRRSISHSANWGSSWPGVGVEFANHARLTSIVRALTVQIHTACFLLSRAESERASGRASVRFSSHIETAKIFAACSPRAPRNEGGFTADATR